MVIDHLDGVVDSVLMRTLAMRFLAFLSTFIYLLLRISTTYSLNVSRFLYIHIVLDLGLDIGYWSLILSHLSLLFLIHLVSLLSIINV